MSIRKSQTRHREIGLPPLREESRGHGHRNHKAFRLKEYMAKKSEPPQQSSHRNALTIFAVVSTALAVLLVFTYLQYVLLAIVLAYVLTPVQRRLEQWLSSATAAVATIAMSIVVFFIPVVYVLAIAFQQGLALLTAIQEGAFRPGRIEDRFETIGFVVDLDLLYATYQDPITQTAQRLATGTLSVIGGLPGVLIGLTVTGFVLFALLRDGDRFVAWLESVVPVDDRVQRELFVELDHLMWASVVGNVAVAGIQAVLLGIGLALVGMSGVVFLTVATFILTLLPLIGTFGVWVPVSIYLLLVGRPVAASAILVYGSIISVSDIYLRPVIIGRSGAINAATIVVGIFGGLVVFGAIGLFIGPVVLGGAKIILDLFARENAQPIAD
ncbi:AI-2E family transporter [Natrinema sp. HArc-T2]|uniref:AI-2E family transporter n=1 Tax=Natrinema sp. HArc-T2 TaxID=3242701 RepID=UPI00359E294C